MKNKIRIWISVVFLIQMCHGSINITVAQNTIYGVVTSIHDSLPLQYVTVVATGSETLTDETDVNGYYSITTDPGNYQIETILLGYDTITIDTVLSASGDIELNLMMNRTAYPVPWVNSVLSEDGDSCYVDWGLPSGPYEIIVDDGSAEEFRLWDEPHGGCAVMVIPEHFPAKITGGRVFIGDGSFPIGSNIIGTQLRVGIVDNDGYMGLAKTILDSTTITVTNYGWLEFNNVFDLIVEDEVLLAIWQLNGYLDSAPIGVDTDAPVLGYSYFKHPSSDLFSYESDVDLMIRAYVDGPNPGLLSMSRGTDELIGFSVGRVNNFDPCLGPESGTITPLASVSNTTTDITDIFMGGIAPGLLAYAIRPIYDFGSTNWTSSNTVLRGNKTVNFEIAFCNGILPDSALITMTYIDSCLYAEYHTRTNEIGFASQDNVGAGLYNIQIEALNQPTVIIDSVLIINDTTIYFEFSSGMLPPRNISIGSLSNTLTWDPPLVADILIENFEDTIFPPNWWWDLSNCRTGWHRMEYDTNYAFYVPPGDGYFALADNVESNFNGCDNNHDYLFMPMLSFMEGRNYYLQFDYYFDQKVDDYAYVVFKDVNYWQIEILESLSSSNGWKTETIDISGLASYGSQIVNIGFHHKDYAWHIPTGFAVDNIRIFSDEPAIEGYQIYLDGIIIDTVSDSQTSYQFLGLNSGQSYEVCVDAIYECGNSEQICENWIYYEQPIYSIPYFEGWDNKQSILNDWIVVGHSDSWTIDNDLGNPAPSVHASGDSVAGLEYASSFISPMINAEDILMSSIFFEFDIRQDLVTATGSDTLRVAVSDGANWHYVYETISTSGFDFDHRKFDISNIALGNIIQLKIETNGMNTSNINWYIDNISVYEVCNSPKSLVGEGNWDEFPQGSVKITWELPSGYGTIAQWKHWDNGINFTAVAADNNFSAAIRWDANQFSEYEYTYITKVRFFPYEGFTKLELRIWSGYSAQELLYSQDVTESVVPREWNEFILEEPVLVDITKELWIGYNVHFNYGSFPAGVDEGPAIIGYGDMVSFDDYQWFRLSDGGLFYNWNIQAFMVGTYNDTSMLSKEASSNRNSLSGFNIYRKVEESEFDYYDHVEYTLGQDDFVYFDTVPNVALHNGYSYKVTALWQNDLDFCESDPALSKLVPDEDFVYVFLEDIPESISGLKPIIYPNPAKEYVIINSPIPIRSISIVDLNGKIIYYEDHIDKNDLEINFENTKSGVYLVKLVTDNEIFTQKIVVSK